MVIAVAFFGYRLLLGRGLLVSDAVGLAVKLGIVLLIATSWQSWQALAYQGLARAPSQVASELLVGIGASPPLESLENALDGLTAATVGYRTRAGIASPWVGGPAAAAMVLNVSAVILTLATVGILVATRVVLAILLAIAPAMAGFLLFDSTRGMAQGWLGGMAAAAMAPLFVLLVAAIEFAIMLPMISRLLAEQAAGQFENTSVMPIGLVAIVFAVALVMAVRAGARIGYGIRLKGSLRSSPPVSEPTVAVMDRDARRQLLLPAATSPRVARALEVIARRDAQPASPRLRQATGVEFGSSASRKSRDSARTDRSVAVETIRRRPTNLRSAHRQSRAATRRDA
ncbi:MAG: type IV secretion system protein [Pseudomonadota bacterium]|nr:type IV secretion system protein [Pseudomonadota bacterium]